MAVTEMSSITTETNQILDVSHLNCLGLAECVNGCHGEESDRQA